MYFSNNYIHVLQEIKIKLTTQASADSQRKIEKKNRNMRGKGIELRHYMTHAKVLSCYTGMFYYSFVEVALTIAASRTEILGRIFVRSESRPETFF